MKTAITTILWGKLKTLGQMKAVFAEAKEIGFDGVGLETRFLPPVVVKDPRLVRKALHEVPIRNAGSYSTMKMTDIGWAAKSGTPLLWVVARGDLGFEAAAEEIGRMAAEAADSGIEVAVHHHLRTPFETEAQTRRLLDRRRELRVCYDTAHAEAAGFNQTRFIRDYGDRMALVHLKDLRVRLPKAEVSLTRDFVNAGLGIVDFPEVFAALRDVGYSRAIMLETEALRGTEPGVAARQGYRLIQRSLREA